MKDSVLLAQHHNVYGCVDPKVSKENALNLLEELISLYLSIRSHSFAKDITQSHKKKKKRSKEWSLRTSIKTVSGSLEFGHCYWNLSRIFVFFSTSSIPFFFI